MKIQKCKTCGKINYIENDQSVCGECLYRDKEPINLKAPCVSCYQESIIVHKSGMCFDCLDNLNDNLDDYYEEMEKAVKEFY